MFNLLNVQFNQVSSLLQQYQDLVQIIVVILLGKRGIKININNFDCYLNYSFSVKESESTITFVVEVGTYSNRTVNQETGPLFCRTLVSR